MYHHPPDEMLLCTHVDDFLLSATSFTLAKRLYAHYSLHHDCKFFIAGTFVGIDIVRDRDARKMYISQSALIDRLLESEFNGIMSREELTGNDLSFNPGQQLHKWEQLCPCSTPFDYKMPKLSSIDSHAEPDHALVHRMQVVVGTLMYILNSRPDCMHSVHQVARFVHNPGPAHVKALDHILRYLAGTADLCLIIGNWTDVDYRFLAGFHVNADASHKKAELDFRGITGIGVFAFGTLLLTRSFVQDQVAASSCESEYYSYSTAVKDLEYLRLLLPIFSSFLMMLRLLPCSLTVSQPWPSLRVRLIALGLSTLILPRLCFVVMFSVGEWFQSIVLLIVRLLTFGLSRSVQVHLWFSGVASWVLCLTCVPSVGSCRFVFQLCPLVATLRGCSVPTDGNFVSEFKFQLFSVVRVKI